jgi:hypothetical protein
VAHDEFSVIVGCDCQRRLYYFGACDKVLTLLFSCKIHFIEGNDITSIPTEIGELISLTRLVFGK